MSKFFSIENCLKIISLLGKNSACNFVFYMWKLILPICLICENFIIFPGHGPFERYFTNWSFILITIALSLQMVLLITFAILKKFKVSKGVWNFLSIFEFLEFIFTTVSYSASLLVMIVFWSVIYDGKRINYRYDFPTHVIPVRHFQK